MVRMMVVVVGPREASQHTLLQVRALALVHARGRELGNGQRVAGEGGAAEGCGALGCSRVWDGGDAAHVHCAVPADCIVMTVCRKTKREHSCAQTR